MVKQAAAVIFRPLLLVLLLMFSLVAKGSDVVSHDDPLEGMNRTVFSFNEFLDTYALKPVAKGYDFIAPKPVKNLASNFFNNLGEVRNTANATLQFRPDEALISLGRLVINSTLGMLGLVDVAGPIGLEQRYNDFGMTMARWGLPSGPYLVLPFFGPSTLRAGVGRVPDFFADPLTYYEPKENAWIARGVNIINSRSQLLSAEELIVGDKYTFLRDSYLQRRAFLITGEQPEDDF